MNDIDANIKHFGMKNKNELIMSATMANEKKRVQSPQTPETADGRAQILLLLLLNVRKFI